jgi:hypothetical protein
MISTSVGGGLTVGQSGTAISASNKVEDAADTGTSGANKLLRLDGSGNLPALNGSALTNVVKFGGTGADGALTVTSGNTNIDCGAAQIFVKNYTSISITGTGSITFTNPHANGTIIIIKSQGAVTLTSSAAPMIDVSGMGGAGGTGATGIGGGTVVAGGNGTAPTIDTFVHFAPGGGGGGGTGAVGAAGTAPTPTIGTSLLDEVFLQYPILQCGAGGGGGSATSGNGVVVSGNGGRGGGALLIECGGAWNFTTTNGISVAGKIGTDGSKGASTAYTVSGGSGGGAGMFLGLYNSLTANSGTINVSGGSYGSNFLMSGYAGTWYGPGSGASPISAGTIGVGQISNNTSMPVAGANGYSKTILNTFL